MLERAGLIERSREAQFRPCKLKPEPLKQAWGWIGDYRQFWEESFDRLDAYLQKLQAEQKKGKRRKSRSGSTKRTKEKRDARNLG